MGARPGAGILSTPQVDAGMLKQRSKGGGDTGQVCDAGLTGQKPDLASCLELHPRSVS